MNKIEMIWTVYVQIMGCIHILSSYNPWRNKVDYAHSSKGLKVKVHIHSTVAQYIMDRFPCDEQIISFTRSKPKQARNKQYTESQIYFANDTTPRIDMFNKETPAGCPPFGEPGKRSTFWLWGLNEDILMFLNTIIKYR